MTELFIWLTSILKNASESLHNIFTPRPFKYGLFYKHQMLRHILQKLQANPLETHTVRRNKTIIFWIAVTA